MNRILEMLEDLSFTIHEMESKGMELNEDEDKLWIEITNLIGKRKVSGW
tara:strand:+ start:20076 stop:20222 length:147 start_codon:yes stop_codon:yes gene_type:complete